MREIVNWPSIRAISLPVLAGLLVRGLPGLTSGFPLNDGGLFLQMTRDLQAAGYQLPNATTYNGMGIPFAYPPLGFYAAGLSSDALGVGLIDLFRVLPVLFATLAIPVVYLVAREILDSRFQALLATWAFALLPRAFDWLVLGGGVTRSLGMLFAMLAILEGIRFYRLGARRHGLAMAVFAALAALSHPEGALFAALSLVLIMVAYRPTVWALRDSVLMAGLAAAIAAPWWVTVLLAHGPGPFLSGGQTGLNVAASVQGLLTFSFTDEPYATVLAAVGLIGLIHRVARRSYLLPAWVVVIFAIDPRGAATGLMLPVAMLIGAAIDEVLLSRIARDLDEGKQSSIWPTAVVRDRYGRLLLGAGLVFGIIGAVKAPTMLGSPLHALSSPNREAMGWIETNVPATAEFVVLSGGTWFLDATSEWFPALTGHRSIATVQGYEWLGKQSWDSQLDRYSQLQRCAYSGADCFVEWAGREGVTDAWVYVPIAPAPLAPTDDCCEAIRNALSSSRDYAVAYAAAGGVVFRPRTPP